MNLQSYSAQDEALMNDFQIDTALTGSSCIEFLFMI